MFTCLAKPLGFCSRQRVGDQTGSLINVVTCAWLNALIRRILRRGGTQIGEVLGFRWGLGESSGRCMESGGDPECPRYSLGLATGREDPSFRTIWWMMHQIAYEPSCACAVTRWRIYVKNRRLLHTTGAQMHWHWFRYDTGVLLKCPPVFATPAIPARACGSVRYLLAYYAARDTWYVTRPSWGTVLSAVGSVLRGWA